MVLERHGTEWVPVLTGDSDADGLFDAMKYALAIKRVVG